MTGPRVKRMTAAFDMPGTPAAPRVFISYSHDSDEHKRWVRRLAVRLRESGVNVFLDQWDLKPGGDVTLFMEREVAASDRVLLICTDDYIRKADAGEGGVGYERMIVTAELVKDQGTTKFIPVVRNVSGEAKVPGFLRTRAYIDFSSDDEFESKIAELSGELHGVAAKPPLGENPFSAATPTPETPAQVSYEGPPPWKRRRAWLLLALLAGPLVATLLLAVFPLQNPQGKSSSADSPTPQPRCQIYVRSGSLPLDISLDGDYVETLSDDKPETTIDTGVGEHTLTAKRGQFNYERKISLTRDDCPHLILIP